MTIRAATSSDLPQVEALLTAAFHDDPVSIWLFPGEDRRREVHPPFFRAFAESALESGGAIHVRTDGLACTVWLAGDDSSAGADFGMLADDEAKRFGELATLTAEHHPDRGPFAHLQFIAVHPERQRHGLGSELLEHDLAILDERGTPAYLEASSVAGPPLYRRHGFYHFGTPFGPGPQVRMYPMWRDAPRSTK